MIDTMNRPNNPKVVICSTIMNVAPLEMMLWRNYGYRSDQEPVYKVRERSGSHVVDLGPECGRWICNRCVSEMCKSKLVEGLAS